MATGRLTTDKTTVSVTSTWNGYQSGYGEIRYTNPTTGSVNVTVTIPEAMQGARFVSAHVNLNLTQENGSASARFNADRSVALNDANMLSRLQNGDDLTLNFIYRAQGGYGAEGQNTAYAIWRDLYIEVEYQSKTILKNLTRIGRLYVGTRRAVKVYKDTDIIFEG